MAFSIRTRLTVWYSALMALGLTVFSLGVLWLHAHWARAQFDTELAGIGAATARVMQEELGESGNLKRAVSETRTSMDVPGRTTAILAVGGAPLAAHWHGFQYEPAMWTNGDASPRFATTTGGGRAWRVLTRRETSAAGDYVILVAGTFDQLDRQQYLLSRVLLVATPLIVLLTGAVSWLVASSALKPMTTMAAEAESVTARSEDWRLSAPTSTDELGQLARAFNRLLGRLATASQTQRQFMADASHELRTPVSVIQTATEVTLELPARDEWEYREALTIVNEQSTRLAHLVEDMLVLARADAGGYPIARRALYLDEIVAECVRAISVVAATRSVTLVTRLEPDVSMNGDDGMLRQLVTNLLDNAVQHTPPGGVVTVAVKSDATVATVAVSDTGVGVPLDDRERIFERFVRLDPARSSTSGAGLGLPIARWIAEQHQGTLTLEPCAMGGCLFVARLPLNTAQRLDRGTATPVSPSSL